MVKEVAADLRLAAPGAEKSPADAAHSAVAQRQEPFSWPGETDTVAADDVWISRFGSDSFSMAPILRRRASRNRQGSGVIAGALIGLVTLGGVGATLYSRQVTEYLGHSVRHIEDLTERGVNTAASPPTNPVQRQSEPPLSQLDAKPTTKEVPAPESVPPSTAEPAEALESLQNREENFDKPNGANPTARKVPSPVEPRRDSDLEKRRIEAEVVKAIQNRAISGVSVSVVNGVAYLDGRVASVRQKLMAERAARSVADVKDVRNRLAVGPY